MTEILDLVHPEIRLIMERCQAQRKANYRSDTAETNKQCERFSSYRIDGKYYCKPHASIAALEILMGEIIRAASKVLTVDDIKEEIFGSQSGRFDYHGIVSNPDKWVTRIIKKGHENGRLEMWLEFKKGYDEAGAGTIPVFFNTLENLKPLRAE